MAGHGSETKAVRQYRPSAPHPVLAHLVPTKLALARPRRASETYPTPELATPRPSRRKNTAKYPPSRRHLSPSLSMSESLTQKWLRQNVSPYSNRERVYADIDALLARFPTLRPKSDVYSSVSQFTTIRIMQLMPCFSL